MEENYKFTHTTECEPSPKVVRNILKVAKLECEIIARGKRVRLRTPYQHIPFGKINIKVCLN